MITPEEEQKLYEEAVNKWGEPAQLLMWIEETSELNHAICAYLRNRDGAINSVIEELADCEIMLNQLKVMFYGNHFIGQKQRKLQRLKERLNK